MIKKDKLLKIEIEATQDEMKKIAMRIKMINKETKEMKKDRKYGNLDNMQYIVYGIMIRENNDKVKLLNAEYNELEIDLFNLLDQQLLSASRALIIKGDIIMRYEIEVWTKKNNKLVIKSWKFTNELQMKAGLVMIKKLHKNYKKLVLNDLKYRTSKKIK